MKREQLTNVETEAVNPTLQCSRLAGEAEYWSCAIAAGDRSIPGPEYAKRKIIDCADRIIALRTAELANAAQVAK